MKVDIAKVKSGTYKNEIVVIEYYDQYSGLYIARLLDRLRPCLKFKRRQLDFSVNERVIRGLYEDKINSLVR